MRSAVGEAGWSKARASTVWWVEKDRVAGGLGELLDAGSDVDGVADWGELELACPADGASDHHTGVDSDTRSNHYAAADPLGFRR